MKHRDKNAVNVVKKKLSRKQLRKKKRTEKKVRKNEYYSKRQKLAIISKQSDQNVNTIEEPITQVHSSNNMEQIVRKEQKKQKKLQKEMTGQRNKQLKLANEDEDRNIKKLEQQLKLNKRKSKTVPKSFSEDGLDFLLELCDPDKMNSAIAAEQQFADVNDDFAEDLALMSGKESKPKKKKNLAINSHENTSENSDEEDQILEYSSEEIDNYSDDDESNNSNYDQSINSNDDESTNSNDEEHLFIRKGQKRKIDENNDSTESKMCKMSTHEVTNRVQQADQEHSLLDKKQLLNIQNNEIENQSKGENWEETSLGSNEDITGSSESKEDVPNKSIKGASKINPDGTWEDIYGRVRSKEGDILNNSEQKYVPRAIRLKMETNEQEKEVEKLNRLKKQLKGLINRLAENNMHNISSQIEELYMSHSRNDMNETLTNLILESVVSNVICPERLLMGNVLLIVILHANIGTEVGAHFLQTVVSKFTNNLNIEAPVEDKNFDNIVMVLAQLYNFRLFDSKLIYEILYKLSENFNEKNIDCILYCLRTVGFSLRKDNPLALKDLILELQKSASTASQNVISGTRVKFLLDILLAVKNNNMSKIPNYDNSYSEHLKKIMKGFIRKGNYVTQLSISLEDLLKAEERGKWWVVGSAWTGNTTENKETLKKPKSDSFSQKLLELARKQRMNTDTRRNIFCILMSAEDYLDAFEKLLHLGLTKNQNREIIHVILHCCLHENPYNPYYAILTQKFCDYDRKYQLTIKYSIWDKLKALGEQSAKQSSNLAKLLIHLFLEKGLSISILKIVQFSELDKITLRFMRQILLGILLHENIEECTQVFENVAQSDKLKMFRESIRLFIHHFMLKNINSEQIDEKQSALLQTRAKIIDKLLVMKERSRF